MSVPNPHERADGTSPLSDLTSQASFVDEADVAADLFDLAAPPLQQPLVARLVPLYTGLPTFNLHQDSGTVVVGRGKELNEDYRIDGSDKLSAKHCELIVDPLTLRIELRDISTNGTFVNGARVTRNSKVVLQNGDKVSLTRPVIAETATDRSGSGSNGVSSSTTSAENAVADINANGRVAYVLQRLKSETTRTRMLEELTCSVCRAVFHRPCSVLPCMHVFCAGCISAWLRQGESHVCPECRETITDVRPTHRLQNCTEYFLLSDPCSRRPAEDLAALDAADAISPAGLKLRKRQRNSGSDEGEFNVDEKTGGNDNSENHSGDGGALRMMRQTGTAYVNAIGCVAARCTECDMPSAIDGFQCPAGGPHLRCTACTVPFAERPLCGRPQRCHVCNAAFCGLYRAGGCSASHLTPFKQYKEHTPIEVLPPQTFNGNTIEQSILSTYLASHSILMKDAWAITLSKFESGTWVPDIVLINGAMAADSPVCQRCAVRVFAELLFHYRRSIPSDELPESVTKRLSCWYGKECRTQFHNLQHAQKFNHVSYQEKRKE